MRKFLGIAMAALGGIAAYKGVLAAGDYVHSIQTPEIIQTERDYIESFESMKVRTHFGRVLEIPYGTSLAITDPESFNYQSEDERHEKLRKIRGEYQGHEQTIEHRVASLPSNQKSD